MNLYEALAAGFRHRLDRAALVTAQSTLTYSDIEGGSARVANCLRANGVLVGDRVCVQVDKSAQGLLTYLGCLRYGAVFVPLNPAYRADEIAYFLKDAAPSLAICRPQDFSWFERVAGNAGVAPAALFQLDAEGSGSWATAVASERSDFDRPPTDDDDLAALVYTSGTTGRSKGAMITHRNLVSNAIALQNTWGFVDTDVLVHALPIFHVHGLFVATHTAMLTGIPILFHHSFDAAAVLDDFRSATVFMGVPTMYTRLLANDRLTAEACAGMRLFVSGSAPLLAETFDAFAERTGHTVLERYGMTETGMNTSNPYTGIRKRGTVGRPLPGVAVRVVDSSDCPQAAGVVGNVQVKGPNVLRGYWRRPDKDAEEFTEDGWFRTGDVGVFDDDGYLELVGRSKDLVISGGFNVYPKEIELLLDEMPGVVESAVIGIPDADFGEAVTAVITVEDGVTVDSAAMIADLKTRLASFKVPKSIHVVAELPRNAMGKVQKNVLRLTLSGEHSAGTAI
jgi:malonyl-CoA/methylmalonyl-CoA synthetase